MHDLDLSQRVYRRITRATLLGIVGDAAAALRAWLQYQQVKAESSARRAAWQADQITKPARPEETEPSAMC